MPSPPFRLSRKIAGAQACSSIDRTPFNRLPFPKITERGDIVTIPTQPLDPEKQPALTRVDSYAEWREREGAPLIGGVFIEDMKAVEVGPWPRKGDGVKGALCYLDGDNGGDEHIVELPPGGYTAPLRHMYTEAIYVVSGHGSCSGVARGRREADLRVGPRQLLRAPHQRLAPVLQRQPVAAGAVVLRHRPAATLPAVEQRALHLRQQLRLRRPLPGRARLLQRRGQALPRPGCGRPTSSRTSASCRSTSGRAGAAAAPTRSWSWAPG